MTRTQHDNLRSIAEQLSGKNLPGKSSTHYIEVIEQQMGTMVEESTGSDYTISSPNTDTLNVDTSDGAVTVTIADTFKETGAVVTVSDISNNAATNNITVTAETGNINGQSNILIDVNGGAIDVEVAEDLAGTKTLQITGTVGQIL